jgi:ankyrin repeat protein
VVALSKRCSKCVKILVEHGADPNTVLLQALRDGDYDMIKDLLHHGANPNFVFTRHGVTQTPLAIAMTQQSGRFAKMLSGRLRPLTDAIRTDHQDIVRMLLEHGADASGCSADRERPLTMAIREGQQEAVRMLLEHGADANGGSAEFGRPLTDAVSRPGLQDIVRLLLAHGADPGGSDRHRSLSAAINTGNEEATRLLLDAGADHLHAAICTRNEAETRLLLSAGADVRVRDRMGRSYLHALCLECSLEYDRPWEVNSIAELLLDAGVDINATYESQKTALIMAFEMGHFGLLLLLVRRGANVNAHDAANGTISMMAARQGSLSVVQILLDAGADINAVDVPRRTALTMAVETGNLDVARLLVDRGANLDMHGHEGVARYLRLRMAEEDAVAGLDGCDRMSE